jgi:hypothetical protein
MSENGEYGGLWRPKVGDSRRGTDILPVGVVICAYAKPNPEHTTLGNSKFLQHASRQPTTNPLP